MLKSIVQGSVRAAHVRLLNKGLPPKVGVYFHSISPDQYEGFRAMVAAFDERRYRFAGPDDFLSDPDEPCVFVSFDDCYRAWFEALPLFKALGRPLTFYVNTCCFRDTAPPDAVQAYYDRLSYTGERMALSTEELRALRDAGLVIGAHTHSHYKLTALSEDDARREIYRSKVELEAVLGEEIRHFSYPYGMRRHFSEALRAYCREIGFTTVANAIPGLLHVPPTPLRLNRTGWQLDRSVDFNMANLSVDGHHVERLTGRSAIG